MEGHQTQVGFYPLPTSSQYLVSLGLRTMILGPMVLEYIESGTYLEMTQAGSCLHTLHLQKSHLSSSQRTH